MNPAPTIRTITVGRSPSLPEMRGDARAREGSALDVHAGSGMPQADEASGARVGQRNDCFLWIDLTRGKNGSDLFVHASRSCRPIKVRGLRGVADAVLATAPLFLCFEFDCCEPADLLRLRDTRLRYPALPILMLTEGCSQELSGLAFRMGVWECLVKPVPLHELDARIATLTARCRSNRPDGAPAVALPAPSAASGLPDVPAERPAPDPRTEPAVSYIAANFQDKVSLEATARVCHLSPSHFSRVFKREHGVTFCRYVMRYRIAKACELLARTPAQVKHVCFAVGFNDHSYFSRMFRRIVGVRPTEYPLGVHER
jgi:AraC-like DNA-binding protein